ncbi:23S rRNA pseudouridine2605 synthase [Bacillus mesophilus]|uniref:Pseudouridine synthase n=1 Tax=Bacillus mesophilus TaxID=1808955 RepID=A0A6M0Q4H5_9BACI|nr:pseudouridine synthase [Bacillus mesophilus]MBM7661176.1 23S rRNA pseudouridine2605 synthase [Bacillus mesophilus]NEY71297.1 rRNA pseudouridine synthase [Bacillus mesophilus]
MERLQKVIAQAGVSSRRKAEELIAQGRVTVNGKVIKELGTKVSSNDKVEVNGIPLEREQPVYYLLYKPTGVISSVSDDKGRKVVTDFFPLLKERIYPIGRLDYDTSGVLLLTNDGDFANTLMHPKHEVDKVYIAKVKGMPTREQLRLLATGVKLEDGITAPAKTKLISSDKKKNTSIIQIIIHEGRNRQVRRMFDAIGCPVIKLKREQYGFITLHGLTPGESRELSPHEVKQLRAQSQAKTRK